MADSPYVRLPHYQRHHQSMLLNLCSIYPYFETDSFDRAYNEELASVTSTHPKTNLDFCYYWTEKVMWRKFGLSDAYGEFPGRYTGPEFIVQEQKEVDTTQSTLASAQPIEPAPGISPQLPVELSQSPSIPAAQRTRPVLGQAPALLDTPVIPASRSYRERIDLVAMASASNSEDSVQKVARNLFDGFLRPQDKPAPDQQTSSAVQLSQDVITGLPTPNNLPTQQEVRQSPASPAESALSTLLAARIFSPNPFAASADSASAVSSSLPTLHTILFPDTIFKDSTTGETMTLKMFERRCFSRGADVAIKHVHDTIVREKGRLTRARAHEILVNSLNTTLFSIIDEHTQQ